MGILGISISLPMKLTPPLSFGRSFRFAKLSRSGFSLVELMVTVGIITILTAVAIPVSREAMETSRQGACISNMRALANGCILFAQDNDGKLPFTTGSGAWHRLIYPYLSTTQETTDWQKNVHEGRYYICPADKTPYQDKMSYAWNKNLKGASEQFRIFSGSRALVMLGEGVSYAFDLTDKTGLEFRHKDRANFAFTDGHVASHPNDEALADLIKVEQ